MTLLEILDYWSLQHWISRSIFKRQSFMIHYSRFWFIQSHGSYSVSNLKISLNFPHNQETPSRADSVMTQFPWSKLFFSVENLAVWLLNAHGWEVGCKLGSSDGFFLACFVELQWGWACFGWAVEKAGLCFNAYQLGSEIHRKTLCKFCCFFPWSLLDSSIIPLQLLNKNSTWHPDVCFQTWYVRVVQLSKNSGLDSNLWAWIPSRSFYCGFPGIRWKSMVSQATVTKSSSSLGNS